MSRTIHLGRGLTVNAAEVATQIVAALGIRGSGKSNIMAVIAEGLLHHRIQVIVLDYVGIWFSLRLAPDGKSPSPFEPPVLGGRHGDIPLTPTGGRTVAEALASSGSPAIIDVSEFSKGDRCRFATDFAEALFHAKKKHPGPCFLMVEESQRFIPQKFVAGQERMLGAFEEIAEVGRNYGLGLGLISQRPQKINKDVLNLTELLFAFQSNGVLERKAIAEWVQEKGADGREEVNGELPSLERGHALVWSPSWLRIYGEYALDKKTTYDAGATPIHARAAVKMKALDLEALKVSMSEVVEQAKADDPRALRAEIEKLRKALKVPGVTAPKIVEVLTVPKSVFAAANDLITAAAEVTSQVAVLTARKHALNLALSAAVGKTRQRIDLDKVAKGLGGERVGSVKATSGYFGALGTTTSSPFARTRRRENWDAVDAAKAGALSLSRAARAILGVLSQRGYATDSQAAILSGYSITSSSFSNALSELRTEGYMTGDRSRLTITDSGRAAAPDMPPLPSDGRELLRYWQGKLGACERSMLGELFERREMSREALSETTGYSITSSSFSNGLSKLRTLELVTGRDPIQIAETFT
jgi:hypothetical protein